MHLIGILVGGFIVVFGMAIAASHLGGIEIIADKSRIKIHQPDSNRVSMRPTTETQKKLRRLK